jgi:hypothetical protein
MRDSGLAADDLQCIEFVSVVTDYLDGEANEDDRRRIDKHLEHCRGCQAALEVTIQDPLCRGLGKCCDSPTLMWLREFDSRLGTARLSLVRRPSGWVNR